MPSSSKDSIRRLCRRRIAALPAPGSDPDRFENRVVRLVEENLASGRFQRVAANRAERHPLRLAEYVDRVIACASRESARVQALEGGDAAEWNRLHDFLLRRALPMVHHFRDGADAFAEAANLTQEACIVIFGERYPCDVSFDAWATTILKRLVLKHFTRSSDVLDRPDPPESLDRPKRGDDAGGTPLGDLMPALNSLAPFAKIENQSLLLDAIGRLRSPVQRQVIYWAFLEEWDDTQIAQRLGKSEQAVYNLRQRALVRLRKILGETPRKKSNEKRIRISERP